jgi:hypothetical protein
MIERNFSLRHLTTAHKDADMTKTFEEVGCHYIEHNPYKITPNRKTEYIIPKAIDQGRKMLASGGSTNTESLMGDDVQDEGEAHVELEDILVELV